MVCTQVLREGGWHEQVGAALAKLGCQILDPQALGLGLQLATGAAPPAAPNQPAGASSSSSPLPTGTPSASAHPSSISSTAAAALDALLTRAVQAPSLQGVLQAAAGGPGQHLPLQWGWVAVRFWGESWGGRSSGVWLL